MNRFDRAKRSVRSVTSVFGSIEEEKMRTDPILPSVQSIEVGPRAYVIRVFGVAALIQSQSRHTVVVHQEVKYAGLLFSFLFGHVHGAVST
jgi:hypothetical protein